MQAVILAAGKGKRLHPVSQVRSKAMAPVAGQPMVARVMQLLASVGVDDFTLVCHPDDQDIRTYFAGDHDFGVVRFVEQRERLGMAHALGLAAPVLQGDFILSACDNLVPVEHMAELVATHRERGANATLSLMAIDPARTAHTGIVEWQDGLIVGIVEKPQPHEAPSNISSLPLYLFSERLLTHLSAVKASPRGEYELQDAIQLLIEHDGGVTGVLTPERLQLTDVNDLLHLNRRFQDQEQSQTMDEPGNGVRLIPPLYIGPGVEIGEGCTIGPHVTLEEGCHIGAGAQLEDTIVLRNGRVAAGRKLKHEIVV